MQVKNIECQIAQAQLRRYLTGEEMPNSIVNDLETHLRHCPECMAAAQTLRESLKGVLHAKITGKPEPQPQPTQAEPAPQRALVESPADLLAEPDSKYRPAKKSNWKTLFYSIALAAVLVLMSTVFKDPTKLFGPKAASSVKTDTPPAVETPAGETKDEEPVETNTVTTPPVDPVEDTKIEETPGATSGTAAAKVDEPKKPLETNGLIVAGPQGTQTVKKETPKQQPKPKPRPRSNGTKQGSGTIKVYPPDNS